MRVENLDHVFLCASSVLIAHPHVELCFAVIPIRGQLEAGKGHLVLPVLHVLKPWESNRNSRVKTVQAPLAWKWCTADQPPPGFVNTGEASSGRHSIPIQTSNSEVIPYSKDGGEASPCCCAPLWIQFPPSPPPATSFSAPPCSSLCTCLTIEREHFQGQPEDLAERRYRAKKDVIFLHPGCWV